MLVSDASLTSMGWAGHYLLSRIGAWNAFATRESLGLLGSDHGRTTTVGGHP